MKNGAMFIIGVLFSNFVFASDCLDVAIRNKRDLNETIRYYKVTLNINRGSVSNLQSQACAMTQLIELYSLAEQEKCEGVIKSMFEKLQKRSIRIKNKKRAFNAPTCSNLMARIVMGNLGEFCQGGEIDKFDVNHIRKVIEIENRRMN
ncbi:MAG: hypothetical protein KA715_06105 [Xanthomonadaceae bacterium]|nr:hypothetical protein [Xanthomonadaceae bacterium]